MYTIAYYFLLASSDIIVAPAAATDQAENYHGCDSYDDNVETSNISAEHICHLTCFPFHVSVVPSIK